MERLRSSQSRTSHPVVPLRDHPPRIAVRGWPKSRASAHATDAYRDFVPVAIFATLRILRQLYESHDQDTGHFRVWKSLHMTLTAVVAAWFALEIYHLVFVRPLIGNAKPLLLASLFGVVTLPIALYREGEYGLEELEYVPQIKREATLFSRLLRQALPAMMYAYWTGRLWNGT